MPEFVTKALSWIRMRWIVWIWVWTACAQTLELPATVKQGGVIRVRGPAAAVTARMADRKD